ncbi:MAG TPA: HNH endonuclease [Ilumatobacteraceae bacterium]|nr:HNH endonuclease [Ilumatobacteraceae bacterium]
MADLRRLKSWVEGREVEFAQRIAAVSSFPEKSLAEAANTSVRDGGRLLQRAETAAAVPAFGVSLNDGRVSGEHLDVLTRVMRSVTSVVADQLGADGERLVRLAQHSTPDEFARTVREAARVLEADRDGLDRLERQRRAVRCVSWVDKANGMGRISLTLDPLAYVSLERRFDAQIEALFHDAHPDGCPTDLLEKQQFLRAHALLSLLDGRGARSGRPEIVVVEDHTNPLADGRPSLDWGADVDLPHEVLEQLRPTAGVYAITVRNGVIIDAPGQLDLGRETRLANRAQRRAFTGLYATCGVPGCCVRYSRTKLHHIIWWRHGGRTDMANLIPLCQIHHQNVHHDGWTITLGPNRELTITLPDGQVMTTGPPKRGAA